MTIRSKLNLSVLALIVIFVTAMAVTMQAVVENAGQVQAYSRMREQSRFTSDVTTDIYHHVAAAAGTLELPISPEPTDWPDYALQDVDTQIRLSRTDRERLLWQRVRTAISALGETDGAASPRHVIAEAVETARVNLRALRTDYDLAEASFIATVAATSLRAQVAIAVAGGLMILVFLVHLILVRDWLVRPIEVLKASADAIGEGLLDHRVQLFGDDELAQLARRIDAMAHSLAKHQSELIETREMAAIGALCANVAHGLRNPLAAIRACAQLVERRTRTEETASLLGDLVQQVDRLDERITKVFAFSRIKQLKLDCATFADLAGAARATALPLLDARSIELDVDDRTDGIIWCLDQVRIAEALGELVTNAVHHSPREARILLRGSVVPSDEDYGRLRLQVIDKGAGMAQTTIDKACDLFFTARPNGSGMGLAIVKRLIQSHGGTIAIESELGKGTTVTIVVGRQCPHTLHGDNRENCPVHRRTMQNQIAEMRLD